MWQKVVWHVPINYLLKVQHNMTPNKHVRKKDRKKKVKKKKERKKDRQKRKKETSNDDNAGNGRP